MQEVNRILRAKFTLAISAPSWILLPSGPVGFLLNRLVSDDDRSSQRPNAPHHLPVEAAKPAVAGQVHADVMRHSGCRNHWLSTFDPQRSFIDVP